MSGARRARGAEVPEVPEVQEVQETETFERCTKERDRYTPEAQESGFIGTGPGRVIKEQPFHLPLPLQLSCLQLCMNM